MKWLKTKSGYINLEYITHTGASHIFVNPETGAEKLSRKVYLYNGLQVVITGEDLERLEAVLDREIAGPPLPPRDPSDFRKTEMSHALVNAWTQGLLAVWERLRHAYANWHLDGTVSELRDIVDGKIHIEKIGKDHRARLAQALGAYDALNVEQMRRQAGEAMSEWYQATILEEQNATHQT